MGAALDVVYATSNAEDSHTGDTNFTDTDTVIDGGDLASGTEYLLLYNAGFGFNHLNGGNCRVTVGGTSVGNARYGAVTDDSPIDSMDGAYLSGHFRFAADGGDVKIQHKLLNSARTVYTTGKSLIAIPLDQHVQDTDYWQTEESDGEMHNEESSYQATTTGADADVVTLSPTITEEGNYLVIASCECITPGSGDNVTMRLEIDGVIQRGTMKRLRIVNDSMHCFCYTELHRFTPSSVDPELKIIGGGGGGGTKSFRRGRISVIRANSFQHILNNRNNGAETISGAGWHDRVQRQYPVRTSGDFVTVVSMGSVLNRCQLDGRAHGSRILNETDSTSAADVSFGEVVGGERFGGATMQDIVTVFGCEEITDTKLYKLQNMITANALFSSEASLVLWGMKVGDYVTADSQLDVKMGSDEMASADEWPLVTGSGGTHYTEIDPDDSEPDNFWIGTNGQGSIDSFYVDESVLPTDMGVTLDIILVATYSGDQVVDIPAAQTEAIMENDTVLLDQNNRFNTGDIDVEAEGFWLLGEGPIQLTRDELALLLDQITSIADAAYSGPEPNEPAV